MATLFCVQTAFRANKFQSAGPMVGLIGSYRFTEKPIGNIKGFLYGLHGLFEQNPTLYVCYAQVLILINNFMINV